MAAASPVEPPSGRVKLKQTHAFVAGGLTTLLADGARRKPLIDAIDDASRVAGTVLYAASRLLLGHVTSTVSTPDAVFHPTGLTSEKSKGHEENIGWNLNRDSDEAPYIVTQGLIEWAMALFYQSTRTHQNVKEDPAWQALNAHAVQNDLVSKLGGKLNNYCLSAVLHSLARSYAVVVNNHIVGRAATQHMKLYLIAKYDFLYLSNKEAEQLAVTIGRSHQFNTYRTQLRKGVPYETLPPHRKARKQLIRGAEVPILEVKLVEWRFIVDMERKLLPATWSQRDMLRSKYRMLSVIQSKTTPQRTFKSFTLLPLCRAGRVFLKMNTEGLGDMFLRAGINFLPNENILSVFDQRKLQKLLRHSTGTGPEFVLAGEFFRSDGIQAQIVCGLTRDPKGKKRAASGDIIDDENDDGEEPGEGADLDPSADEDVESTAMAIPSNIEKLIAVDPGRDFLYTAVRARALSDEERRKKFPDLAPLGDGTHVVWNMVELPAKRQGKHTKEYLRKSAKAYDEECGGRLRREKRTWRVRSSDAYKNALARLSEASLACSDETQLWQRIGVHFECHAPIHRLEGSRDVARDRFDSYIKKHKTLGSIAHDFRIILGTDGILVWGGSRWAVGAKGSAPCRSAMVFKHLKKQDFGNRIFTVAETFTSQKDSITLGMEKMEHPRHPRYISKRSCHHTSWASDSSVISKEYLGKRRVGVLGGGRPYGLYLSQEGLKRTFNRDINGASNMWRCYWEQCHGRPRPLTLQTSKKKNLGDTSGSAATREGQPVPSST